VKKQQKVIADLSQQNIEQGAVIKKQDEIAAGNAAREGKLTKIAVTGWGVAALFILKALGILVL